MTYDPTKEYQTRDGREVILPPELDRNGTLHGLFRNDEGTWTAVCWNGETLALIGGEYNDDLDLVEKPKTSTVWVYMIERNDGSRYYIADDMRLTQHAFTNPGNKVKSVARLEMIEGEGLEDE